MTNFEKMINNCKNAIKSNNIIKFRPHRGGGLRESMELMQEVETIDQILDIVNQNSIMSFTKGDIKIKPYGYDPRIDWDTYIVTIDGYGVVGFTNGEL